MVPRGLTPTVGKVPAPNPPPIDLSWGVGWVPESLASGDQALHLVAAAVGRGGVIVALQNVPILYAVVSQDQLEAEAEAEERFKQNEFWCIYGSCRQEAWLST